MNGDLSYPAAPGWRRGSAETSREAAEFVAPSAGRMLDRVEAYLRQYGPASPEEVTERMERGEGERLLLTSVRARICQLRALGRVVDSGGRSLGESRRVKVIRWRLATAEEKAAFNAASSEAAE